MIARRNALSSSAGAGVPPPVVDVSGVDVVLLLVVFWVVDGEPVAPAVAPAEHLVVSVSIHSYVAFVCGVVVLELCLQVVIFLKRYAARMPHPTWSRWLWAW